MRTVLVTTPGGPEALQVVERPVPEPGPGEVRVRAEAFGVGTPDALIRSGVYKWMPPLPANPGNDVAGRVSAVGAGVTRLAVGTKVLVSARELPQRGGCHADEVVVPADAPFVLDERVACEDAVCLPNYQVALALLQECVHPRAPRSVLVVGAAGGVGSALVQLAKRAGMTVIGSVSGEEKAAFARAQGVDHVVWYRREDVVARVRELTGGAGVGAIFEHAGGEAFVPYVGALGDWGSLVSFNGFSPLPQENLTAALRAHMAVCPSVRSFSFHYYDHQRDARRALMTELITALERGEIRPAIGARLPLAEVRRAHELLESGAALGKIVMTP